MKFTTKVFGCQMNYTDSARIKAVLQNMGFEYTEIIENAEIIVFVTCSIKQKAEDKITGLIKRIDKNKKIRITGCMPQHYLRTNKILETFTKKKLPDQLRVGNFIDSFSNIDKYKKDFEDYQVIGIETNDWKKIYKNSSLKGISKKLIPINHSFNPFFDRLHKTYSNLELVFRIDDTALLPIILANIYSGEKTSNPHFFQDFIKKGKFELHNEYTNIIPQATTMVGNSKNMNQKVSKNKTAFVPISTGCSQFCHYCIVPFARGFERHFDKKKILREVKFYLDEGVEEITLLGQIVNKHPQFVEILKDILKMKSNLKRLRYTSPYPTYYNSELLKLHEQETRLCPHIHIPVQSGSNKILKLMNRGYTIEEFKKMIDDIRNLKRDINITTDIIVGYSQETNEDFQKSMDLVEYCKFTKIFIGKYSVRPGTYGAKNLEDDVPKEIKEYRFMKLDNHFKKVAKQENQKDIGKKTEMFITNIENGIAKGYTENMKNIILNLGKNMSVGDFLKVKIIGIDELLLIGEEI